MPTRKKNRLITDDMLIGEILSLLPEAAELMQDFGLHCTSCTVNSFEPIKAGAMAHGLLEETVDDMIDRINDLAEARRKAPSDGVYLTATAAEKIKEFAKAEEKAGWGLKITAKNNHGKEPAYAMDFQEHPASDEKTFEFHGVSLHLDPESLENMLGAEVDYIDSPYGSGFKISNPKFLKKAACACGGGECGCGE